MNFVRLYKLISNNFQKNEIDVLAVELGFDPENIFPSGGNKTINAMKLVDTAENNGVTLRLLSQIHAERSHLPLTDYLYLAMVESRAFLADEILALFVERYADERGLYPPTKMPDQAQQVQAHFKKEGKEQEFYEMIAARFPQVEQYSFLKPGFVQTAVSPLTTSPAITTPAVDESTTTIPNYVNFDITIDPASEPNQYRISAEVSDGAKTMNAARATLPHDETFQTTLMMLPNMMVNEEMMESVGEKLYSFLFQPGVEKLYTQAKAKYEQMRIRILIRAESTELHQLPWEYIRNAEGYIATSNDSQLVRYLALPKQERTFEKPSVLKILVAMASPEGPSPVDVAGEEAAIRDVLQPLIDDGKVALEVLQKTSRRSLRLTMEKFKPHVLHFIGHGGQNARGEGALMLENRGKPQLVDAENMMKLMERTSSVRLVILAACQTTQAKATSEAQKEYGGFLGMGPRIVWADVPAVIAMQTIVEMETAATFVQELYYGLEQGLKLDTAVHRARFAVFFDEADEIYWGIPVLFMRSPDGNIW